TGNHLRPGNRPAGPAEHHGGPIGQGPPSRKVLQGLPAHNHTSSLGFLPKIPAVGGQRHRLRPVRADAPILIDGNYSVHKPSYTATGILSPNGAYRYPSKRKLSGVKR